MLLVEFPQGSILGPTLFLCNINDRSMALDCHLASYADDSALIASSQDAKVVADFLSGQLSLCRSWLVDNRLSLHLGKTESILFGTHKKLKGAEFNVRCGDEAVKRVTSVKYLGVTLDQTLNFREHANEILKKANAKLSFLYRCADSLKQGHRRLLCSALINAGLEYCCSAWFPSLLEEFKGGLATMQRKMVRFVRGMDWREHVGEADVWALGWMPFHRRVDYFKAVHVFKVQKSAAPAYISCNFNRVSSVHSHTLRQSDRNFSLSSCSFPPKSFTYSAIVFWNSLPLQLKATESFHPFKKGLTAFLRRD